MSEMIGTFLRELTDKSNQPPVRIFSKTVLSNTTRSKLLSYQEDHVMRLISIVLDKYVALDASDTGIGKTYTASAVCFETERKPIIICPKTLIFNWKYVLKMYGVNPHDVVNYETIKNGKTYRDKNCVKRKKAPYIDLIEADPNDPHKFIYQWNVPKNSIVIFDEVHRCKDPKTENGKLLMSALQLIQQGIPVLMLSATICEKIADMKIPFFLFSLIPNVRNYTHYIKSLRTKYPQYRIKGSKNMNPQDLKVAKENAVAMIIHQENKDFASRIRIKDLGDRFPIDQTCCQLFMADDAEKIAAAYQEIAELMQALREQPNCHHLAKIQKLKQEIELRKVPIFIEQAKLYLEEGKSVVIFVNYLGTLNILVEKLDINCQIHGNIETSERQKIIDSFQSNKEKIIICQMRAGGVGISLHDIHGDNPRVSLISLPDSASDFIQARGRIRRSEGKTRTLQRVICVANVPYEKIIATNLNKKLSNLSAINDGDLDGYKYNTIAIKDK